MKPKKKVNNIPDRLYEILRPEIDSIKGIFFLNTPIYRKPFKKFKTQFTNILWQTTIVVEALWINNK